MVEAKKKTTKKVEAPAGDYKKGKGGRKSATAQVRIYENKKGFTVNGRDYKEYFTLVRHQTSVMAPLTATGLEKDFAVTAMVKGGGITGQAEAVRHGLAWALVNHDAGLKKKLKREGFITRDARVVERKKYGLKKARRRPQWSKR